MKMMTSVAIKNMCYNWKRNILVGAAVCLAAILLFLVPSLGYDAILLEKEMVNELHPNWHAAYRGLDSETAQNVSSSSELSRVGYRCDVGQVVNQDHTIELYYLDEDALDMNHLPLESGNTPQKADEIAVSQGMLEAMGQNARVGDRIEVPYQRRVGNGLEYKETGTFTVTGCLPTTEGNKESKSYLALVSETFVKENIPETDLEYLLYVQTKGSGTNNDIEERLYKTAQGFGIEKDRVGINNEYLLANYADPSIAAGIAVILLIIVIAGVITIYSIYYISIIQNVQEYGRLKAIGATKRQIKQIVQREGMAIAGIAVPVGLLVGSFFLKMMIFQILKFASGTGEMETAVMQSILDNHQISLYHVWIYILAILVSFLTVFIALRKPMNIVGKISPIEAIRYQASDRKGGKEKKGYEDITLFRLTKRTLTQNSRRTVITICSMAATGIFCIALSSILTSSNPGDAANTRMPGQYEIKLDPQEDKEHPEYSLAEMQKNNPLSEEFKTKILNIDGVKDVEIFKSIDITGDQMDGTRGIVGLPEKYWKEIQKAIVEGEADYEDLLSGDSMILTHTATQWMPDVKVGDFLDVQVNDGDKTIDKTIKVIAIADTEFRFTQYNSFIMSDKALDQLIQYNPNYYFHIFADKNYDADVEKQLEELIGDDKRMKYYPWQEEYKMWESAQSLMTYLCAGFIIILGIISIMNLVNTMINSIHARKKELGILQAMGLSEKQLIRMLQMESIAYTGGTFLISLGIGLPVGYGIVKYMIKDQLMGLSQYHFPMASAAVFVLLLIFLQVVISIASGKSVRRESLIERIRFSE